MEISIVDEIAGATSSIGTAQFALPRINVRQLIRARVELEFERDRDEGRDSETTLKSQVNAVIVPSAQEVRLNGRGRIFGPGSSFLQIKGGKLQYDVDRLSDEAEHAFLRGRYFILVEDRQVDRLEDEIDLTQTSEVTFLLLTPLKGG